MQNFGRLIVLHMNSVATRIQRPQIWIVAHFDRHNFDGQLSITMFLVATFWSPHFWSPQISTTTFFIVNFLVVNFSITNNQFGSKFFSTANMISYRPMTFFNDGQQGLTKVSSQQGLLNCFCAMFFCYFNFIFSWKKLDIVLFFYFQTCFQYKVYNVFWVQYKSPQLKPRGVSHYGLSLYIKKYLKAKKEYGIQIFHHAKI